MAVIDWDAWRHEYGSMTFADQQRFYADVAVAHPCQQNFDLPHARETFDRIEGDRLNVVELGGWDGALAEAMLDREDIATWTNYDIVGVPQVCRRENYRLEVLDDYLWNQGQVHGHIFVACHTIEHLTGAELEKLFDALHVEYIYLQAPIGKESGQTWGGYVGSHILEIGWDRIDELLAERGYRVVGPNLWRLT